MLFHAKVLFLWYDLYSHKVLIVNFTTKNVTFQIDQGGGSVFQFLSHAKLVILKELWTKASMLLELYNRNRKLEEEGIPGGFL